MGVKTNRIIKSQIYPKQKKEAERRKMSNFLIELAFETYPTAAAEITGRLNEAEPMRLIDPMALWPEKVCRKQIVISGREEPIPSSVRFTMDEFHFLLVITEIASFIRSVTKAIPINRYTTKIKDE